ncbi:hypothetical protein CASFOL_000131 [Castilleja foliolosa]|uniref:Uncharacterized protein n=1 Tax=Castilleja foliolosa TaxID=1961234 RepID=A0ABD3ERR4_9LAMI
MKMVPELVSVMPFTAGIHKSAESVYTLILCLNCDRLTCCANMLNNYTVIPEKPDLFDYGTSPYLF